MNKQIKITAQIGAFLHSSYATRNFDEAMRAGRDAEAIEALTFSNSDMDKGNDPWLRVGVAEINFSMLPNLDLREQQIRALEALLQAERAESQRKQTALMAEINKLKAIEFSPA